MASREWALKKQQVRMRSRGICERCQIHVATQVHHITYQNLGNEPLCDLQDVCTACHKFVSGKSSYDPLNPPITEDKFLQQQVLEHDLQPDILGPTLAKGLAVSSPEELVKWNTEVAIQIGRLSDNPSLQGRLAQIKLRVNQQFYNRKRAS
jgi:hypothetical protein